MCRCQRDEDADQDRKGLGTPSRLRHGSAGPQHGIPQPLDASTTAVSSAHAGLGGRRQQCAALAGRVLFQHPPYSPNSSAGGGCAARPAAARSPAAARGLLPGRRRPPRLRRRRGRRLLRAHEGHAVAVAAHVVRAAQRLRALAAAAAALRRGLRGRLAAAAAARRAGGGGGGRAGRRVGAPRLALGQLERGLQLACAAPEVASAGPGRPSPPSLPPLLASL